MNPKLGEGPRLSSTERWVMRRSSTRWGTATVEKRRSRTRWGTETVQKRRSRARWGTETVQKEPDGASALCGHEAVENPVGYCDRRKEAVEGPLGY